MGGRSRWVRWRWCWPWRWGHGRALRRGRGREWWRRWRWGWLRRLEGGGGRPLWVPRGCEHEAVAAVRDLGQPCVLVVDYAETRGELVGLLNDVAAGDGGPDLRVLLLARSAGEWWQQLQASAEAQTA